MNTLALISLLLLQVPPAHERPSAPDLSGAWQLRVTPTPSGNEATLTLKKAGDTYVGTVSSPNDNIPAEATLKDKTVTITITAQRSSGPVTFVLIGTIDGDTMGGTSDFAGRAQGTWSAKRAVVAASVDVTGTWVLEVVTPLGKGTPTFTFKQDGEKLTGRYKGLLGESDVTGTVKGADVTFTVEGSIDGNSIRITYVGTVEKQVMKGSVKLGASGEGTFEGKRRPD